MVDQSKIKEACQKSLLSFAALNLTQFKAPYHIKRLATELMKVEAGLTKRLIVSMPPRHGKSFLCSHMFPAWYIGRNPDKYIITSTYNQEFANDFGRKVRDCMASDYYKLVFPKIKLRTDSQAANRLMLKGHDGQYFAVGVGGPTTGRGAHLFLIDDPIKDRLEADSDIYRQRIKDWFSSVAYTRLMPGGAVVAIMTRWHENDLVGQLLSQTHEEWEYIKFPALEGTEALWPEAYSYQDMMRIKATMSEYDWNALYMQNPTPREGILFKQDMMLKGLDNDYASYIISIDPAISTKQDSDETAICVLGVRWEKPLAVDEIETVSGHWTFPEQIKMLEAIHDNYNKPEDNKRVSAIVVEDVAYQKALIQVLTEYEYPVIPMKVTKEKYLRANYVTPLMNQHRVRINSDNLREQMLKFRGKSEKNDRVDAFVNGLTYLKDYESDGYKKPIDVYSGLTKTEKKVHQYLAKQRQNKLGVKDIFTEEQLTAYNDAEFF